MGHSSTDLTNLGLNSYEAAAYVALLGRANLTPTELAARAKIPRQRVYDILESLTVKGLCISRDTSPRSYVGIAPEVALEALCRQRAEELERERQWTSEQAAALIAALTPVFRAGRGENDPLRYIEVYGDTDRIAAQALALARTARVRVHSCIKRPLILTQEQNWRFLRDPLERGVQYRALYERAALADDELRGWMATFAGWGQEIRVVPSLPLKMQSFDDKAVMVSMQDPAGGTPSFTAVVVRNRGMVAMMNLAFERLWEGGKPFKG